MNRLFAIALICLAASGCKTKEYQCNDSIYIVPCYVYVDGFTPAEAATTVLRRYTGGSSFTHLVRADTTFHSYIQPGSGTAKDSLGNPIVFASLDTGWDYELVVPAVPRTYRITGVSYHGPATYSYILNEPTCGMRQFFGHPDSAAVDGHPTAIQDDPDGHPPGALYLHK